jgi:uracil-DNA glycosylase family 4
MAESFDTAKASLTPSILPISSAPSVLIPTIDISRPLPPPLEHSGKIAAMQSLRERAMACTRCAPLAKARKSVVVGVGDVAARLLFVGEAPGEEEDARGEPFVGAAGQKLTQIIQAMGLTRETVYIANVLKCRPDTPGQAYGNRKPRPEEMSTCLPYLQEQIEIIQPQVIVALGATAMEGLFGKTSVFITKVRGSWQSFRGLPVMPTYHPSYILRNQSLSVKRQVWEDMLAVMERLGLTISDKQRGFFLNPAG